ncbi:glycosyltransferase family 2 protein [Nonlabens ponticola]|uniref:Glycosyltransferase family 2 protein n=1 Tax=Nonlabens ponticola TaxID=2496866 RepID=A0A3S9MVB0_9FLAO|nr:glycosyltransferase family 2 protein [Nonlabens ponticola]AZQ43114.1 glycosyltransferase family 2 protein [Nonlabens ponticola]
MDLVSVIMPVFNAIDTLGQALDSIVQQDYRPIEICLVDDKSDDGSYAFAKDYTSKNTAQGIDFKLLQNHSNKGAGFTRNKALELATGRYIAFLDADDLWKPHKLTTQIQAMQEGGKAVSYGAYEIFENDPDKPIAIHKVFSVLTYKELLKTNYLGNLTGIYDASAIGKIPIPLMRKRQDWAMWLDVLKTGGDAIGIQEPIASYRLGDGLSASKWGLIKYNYAVYREHLGYGSIKSSLKMLSFFYEQFLVKRKLKKSI